VKVNDRAILTRRAFCISPYSTGGSSLGFDLCSADDEGDGDGAYGRMRGQVLDELKNYFKPEMLNRLDEIVCFRQLEQESVAGPSLCIKYAFQSAP